MSNGTFVLVGLIVAVPAFGSPLTFDYTGTVVSSSPYYEQLKAGTVVNGTFSYDLSNAIASQSSPGNYVADGGMNLPGGPAPAPAGFVFTATLQATGFSFDANANTDCTTYCVSSIQFEHGTFGAARYSFAVTQNIGFTDFSSTYAVLTLPFDNTDIDITSITPVPEPGSTWLMLSGLGAIGLLARRRLAVE